VSNYPPDPGGVFASDYHRRVAAHLPLPDEDAIGVGDLLERLDSDAYAAFTGSNEGEVRGVLDDLSESGDANYLEGAAGWRLLKAGLDRLTGPALTDVEEVDGELVRVEPPPLDGPRLEEAEAQTRRIEAEDAETEEKALGAAVTEAETRLADAKKAAGVS
jgi:hypothetical protein